MRKFLIAVITSALMTTAAIAGEVPQDSRARLGQVEQHLKADV
jgi:hypothetical protein